MNENERDYIPLMKRAPKEVQELKDHFENGGKIEYLTPSGEWLDTFLPYSNPGTCYRKKPEPEKPALIKVQIMNNWLWDKKHKRCCRCIEYDPRDCHFLISTMSSNIWYSLYGVNEDFELYTGQDEE